MHKSGHWFADLSIRYKLTIAMVASSVVGLIAAGSILMGFASSNARTLAEESLEMTARILAGNTTAALIFNDARTAADTLAALKAQESIVQACLFGPGDMGVARLYAHYVPVGSMAQCPTLLTPMQGSTASHLVATVPVDLKGERIGTLQIVQDLEDLRRIQVEQFGATVIALGVSFVLSIMAAWLLQRSISAPIRRLADTARRVSQLGDYSIRATSAGRDELGQLVQDFNQMLGQVGRRDEEIMRARDDWADEAAQKARANLELQTTLVRLKETQTQLIQSEKLASLGGLVAGVAHEINTPVGVSVTAASTLHAGASELQRSYKEGGLKRSELEEFIGLASESTQIILRNLHRAADLIHSFKQVAVDQSSGESRRFHLKAYIEEVLMSLRPKLKNTIEWITVDCPEDLSIESYPGALAQILTNFVSNSLLHAYTPGQMGRLIIAVTTEQEQVVLRYRDDGCGIPAEGLKRIFDPFFTTKRGSGGSGLGMHIVFNLVTQVLHGTIQVNSEPGAGAEFVITFPLSPKKGST